MKKIGKKLEKQKQNNLGLKDSQRRIKKGKQRKEDKEKETLKIKLKIKGDNIKQTAIQNKKENQK